jgi:Predicted membrane protein
MEMKKMIASLLFYVVSAFGISLTVVASVGVSSLNSLNLSLSEWTSVKVGTITTVINVSFLILCWLMDKQRTLIEYVTMLCALLLFGNVVNFFVYVVLAGIVMDQYSLRLVVFILGAVIGGFGTGQVLRLHYLKFPIEHFCNLLAEKTARNFQFYRYLVDVVCVVMSLVLTVILSLPLFVREGTVISLLLLSSVIHWSKNQLCGFFN